MPPPPSARAMPSRPIHHHGHWVHVLERLAKGTHERGRCWWFSHAPAWRQLPPRQPESTGLGLYHPYVANVNFKCFSGMLQMFHMDVVKVDRNVAGVSEACYKCLFKIFHLFLVLCSSKYFHVAS
jgi:hypothetical protein